MKISLDWLREFVDVDLPPAELMERLTMIGLVVEAFEEKDGDLVLEVETYANRPDTLGHYGIAREVAAMTERPLRWPQRSPDELPEDTAEVTGIQVMDEALCPRYCGLVVRGVRVGPSPDRLRRRIEAMGLRPINNVVDVSNEVLFATGQPIHAFDFDRLAGRRIVVRRALRGETLRTLDGRKVELEPDMLVIADEEKPVALAGIMGGEDSGVTESTRDVFIESATFDPVSIRLTARRLGLATDASYRFERGGDIAMAPEAARMAASLLAEFGGRATRGVLDVLPRLRKPKSLILRPRRIADILGIEVPGPFVERTLAALGFRVEADPKGFWRVGVPTFRIDIDREADLIEEIARFFGYDRIPSVVTPLRAVEPPQSRRRDRIARLRQILLQQGFDEVVNASFTDPEREGLLHSGRRAVEIRNPISARASLLRTTLLPGLLENAAHNRNRGLDRVHLFEAGPVYSREETRCREGASLGLLAAGPRHGENWREKPRPVDFFDLKGALEAALSGLRYDGSVFEAAEHPAFEPGLALNLVYRGEALGVCGRVAAPILAAFSLDGPVFAAEINLAALLEKQPRPFQVAPVPRYPAVVRDLSFLVDPELPWREIRRAVERQNPPHLETFDVVDRFSGPSVPGGKTSLTVRFRFRHPGRTLLAAEVDKVEQEIAGHLKSSFDIRIREGREN